MVKVRLGSNPRKKNELRAQSQEEWQNTPTLLIELQILSIATKPILLSAKVVKYARLGREDFDKTALKSVQKSVQKII